MITVCDDVTDNAIAGLLFALGGVPSITSDQIWAAEDAGLITGSIRIGSWNPTTLGRSVLAAWNAEVTCGLLDALETLAPAPSGDPTP